VTSTDETWPIVHAEQAHALARTGQTIVNAPDAMIFKLYVDDEPLYLPTARLYPYRRVLDMRAGTLARELVWTTPAGKHVRVRSCRAVRGRLELSLSWRARRSRAVAWLA
jgi:alpha,alpha-trehalose phosphorylase